MSIKNILTQPIPDFDIYGELLYRKSLTILQDAQFTSGGTSASLKNTRYAGYCYPRDHGYATRAFLAAGQRENARKALHYILTCELDEHNIMFQRYDKNGNSASYKPPQIDGNAQTILAVTRYIAARRDAAIDLMPYYPYIQQLTKGILDQTQTFANGSLVACINGIIEFPPFEEGFDLYTNAVCYRALTDIATHTQILEAKLAKNAAATAENIQQGIKNYLWFAAEDTFFTGVRRDPSISEIRMPFPKNYLSLSDFEVFGDNEGKDMVKRGLAYHLNGTQNNELGGYNRYHELMGRHNFGNGPWPMVMLRLAQYYIKTHEREQATACFNWVMNVARNNKDKPDQLPEHVTTKQAFTDALDTFNRIDVIAPRPAKKQEYEMILKSKTYKELGLAYAVNPLTWSHSQFILAWSDYTARTPVHNW